MAGFKNKKTYLKKLTSNFQMKYRQMDTKLEGSTPPGVFIGSWGYPKVYAGPMLVPEKGDTSLMDSPEKWVSNKFSTDQLVDFRLNMIRGKEKLKVTDLDNRLMERIRQATLASKSVDSHASFKKKPRGASFNDTSSPHGPSGLLSEFTPDNVRWEKNLDKTFYDWDLKAKPGVINLYEEDVPFSRIQKAFSIGALGGKKDRKLVPTRWSITACDSMLGDYLLDNVKHNDIIDHYRVYEYDSLKNHYAVILLPTAWKYEWMEAFLHVMGSEELLFTDYERNIGKKEYSSVGGCFYSCRFGVLEGMDREDIQAGAIVLREAYDGYVPLGVFNVRENVRQAMKNQYKSFGDLKQAVSYVFRKMQLPGERFIKESTLLVDEIKGHQTRLNQFT